MSKIYSISGISVLSAFRLTKRIPSPSSFLATPLIPQWDIITATVLCRAIEKWDSSTESRILISLFLLFPFWGLPFDLSVTWCGGGEAWEKMADPFLSLCFLLNELCAPHSPTREMHFLWEVPINRNHVESHYSSIIQASKTYYLISV